MKKRLGYSDLQLSLGKVISGMDAVIEGAERHKVKLVIVASDTSEKSKKNIKYVCTNNHINVIELSTIETLSHIIGKKNKAIIGITDKNFSNGIMQKCNRR
ncbi:MAG: ribosomal L7Ae/L30e/S12e/Gadd45 family protein [Clostridia bacterium]|nr:ribosomal L7Ae/L30e/S12e/Gadd45 family protein [Clostridia bacterium]